MFTSLFSIVKALLNVLLALQSPGETSKVALRNSCQFKYTVVSGDTCTIISTKTGVSVQTIYSLNPSVNSECTNLQIGQVLCLSSLSLPSIAPASFPSPIKAPINSPRKPPLNSPSKTLLHLPSKSPSHSPSKSPSHSQSNTPYAVPFAILSPYPQAPVTSSSPIGVSRCQSKYIVVSGDTCNMISTKTGVSVQSIHDLNPMINSQCTNLQIGQVLCLSLLAAAPTKAPSKVSTTLSPLSNAEEIIGYWFWTWNTTPSGSTPLGTTLTLAFSGWVDPEKALRDSSTLLPYITSGHKFITVGGGDSSGAWTLNSVSKVTSFIESGGFNGWDGIAYDIEIGVSGLSSAFLASFAAARLANLQVLVTVSGSQPYDIPDASTLMIAILGSSDVNILSPQLYSSGTLTDFETTAYGTTWSQYASTSSLVVPSISAACYYNQTISYFATQGVTISGYVQWLQGTQNTGCT